MKFLILLMCVSVNAFALDEVYEIDYSRELTDEEYRLNPQLHKAEGEHQCQSPESIGHTCKNLGVGFTDCNQAFYKLKMEDCCSGSKYGGSSIGFKVLKCSKYL